MKNNKELARELESEFQKLKAVISLSEKLSDEVVIPTVKALSEQKEEFTAKQLFELVVTAHIRLDFMRKELSHFYKINHIETLDMMREIIAIDNEIDGMLVKSKATKKRLTSIRRDHTKFLKVYEGIDAIVEARANQLAETSQPKMNNPFEPHQD